MFVKGNLATSMKIKTGSLIHTKNSLKTFRYTSINTKHDNGERQ